MKTQELREKTIDELQELIIDSKKQLFELRLQKSLNKLEDTSKMNKARKLVAKAKTLINEKKKNINIKADAPAPEPSAPKKTKTTKKKEAVKNA